MMAGIRPDLTGCHLSEIRDDAIMQLKIRGKLRITEIQGGLNKPYKSKLERLGWIRAGLAREIASFENLITDVGLLALPRLLANCAGSPSIDGIGVAQSDCSVAFMDLSRSLNPASGFPTISTSDTTSYPISSPTTVELIQRPVMVFYPNGELDNNVVFSAFLGSSEYANNCFNAEALRLGKISGVVFAKRLLINTNTSVYSFTVTVPTTAPVAGDVYTNGASTFSVISYSAGTLYATKTAGGEPAASGNLARSTGSGDNPMVYSAFSKSPAPYIKPSATAVTFDHEFSFARA